MASPQLKNGHTRIANEILEHIAMADLNGTQFKIIMVIWRFTYGFSKKRTVREISLSFLAKKINSTKSHADRELSCLIKRGFINVIEVMPRRGRILEFNKNYDEWDKPIESTKPSKPDKQIKHKYDENSTYYKMAIYFHSLVSAVAKDAGVEHLIRKANLQSWADDFRKLVEIDEVNKHLAKEVMDWVTKDSFWRTNVLSAKKLREKFGELAIKMNATKNPVKPMREAIKDTRDKEIAFSKWVAEGKDPDAFDWS